MWTDADREKYKDSGDGYPSNLTDIQYAVIHPLLDHYQTYTTNLRSVLNALLYQQRTGCQWRYIPKEFGAWQTIRTWHDRFKADGLWEEICLLLIPIVREKSGRNPQPSTALIDSQSVVSGPQAGGRGVDGHKKIKGIKRHLLTCSIGLILAVRVTAANVHDTAVAADLLSQARAAGWTIVRAKVDGLYVGPRIARAEAAFGVVFEVTTKPAGQINKDFTPLPLRWRVEATNGTNTNRSRRLTRNLEVTPQAAENRLMMANARRTLAMYDRFYRET